MIHIFINTLTVTVVQSVLQADVGVSVSFVHHLDGVLNIFQNVLNFGILTVSQGSVVKAVAAVDVVHCGCKEVVVPSVDGIHGELRVQRSFGLQTVQGQIRACGFIKVHDLVDIVNIQLSCGDLGIADLQRGKSGLNQTGVVNADNSDKQNHQCQNDTEDAGVDFDLFLFLACGLLLLSLCGGNLLPAKLLFGG